MTQNKKILKIEELAAIIADLRAKGKTVAHCHGVFDLLHIGHMRYFEQARQMGDILVVTLTPDRFVDKGPQRPAFTETLRAEAIASLSCVDYVAINQWPTAEETLRLLRPDLYVKGSEFKTITSDMTGKIGREAEVVKEIGATLAFTEDIVFSSSNLINRYLSNLPEELQQYLALFRQRYAFEDIQNILDKMSSLRVLVIGDTILDEYQYCEAIGKSSKDPILAMKYQSRDLFAGGVLAVANHLANFAQSVQLVTILGQKQSHEDFIRENLRPGVTNSFAYQPGAPTMIKRRIIDGYTMNKLFEIYVMHDGPIDAATEAKALESLANLEDYDLVVAADFGHGTITPDILKRLVEGSRFLAVNTQANAGNRGFHTVTRFPHADFACIAEQEIRLETRSLVGEIPPMMESIAKKMDCSYFVVTRGSRGCLVLDNKRDELVEIPAFAMKVVDRIGAGDAFFSVAAMAAAQNAPAELIGVIGSAAGAQAVEILGNQTSVNKMTMMKHITSLMK